MWFYAVLGIRSKVRRCVSLVICLYRHLPNRDVSSHKVVMYSYPAANSGTRHRIYNLPIPFVHTDGDRIRIVHGCGLSRRWWRCYSSHQESNRPSPGHLPHWITTLARGFRQRGLLTLKVASRDLTVVLWGKTCTWIWCSNYTMLHIVDAILIRAL